MNDPKSTHLFAFEAEVYRLIEQAGVTVADFFGRWPSMKDAKWCIAHFSYGQGKTAEQGARDWFAECVVPHLRAHSPRSSMPQREPAT